MPVAGAERALHALLCLLSTAGGEQERQGRESRELELNERFP
jgi:hypothetical protein